MGTIALKYAAFGRVFGIEQMSNGRWIAIGHGAGQSAYVLDKIGDADCEQAMQGKLDAWAKRNGSRPVNMPRPLQDLLELGTSMGAKVKG